MAKRLRSVSLDLPPKQQLPFHKHRRHQLSMAEGGFFTVLADGAAFVVPAMRAIIVPPGVAHAVQAHALTRFCSIYLSPEVGRILPDRPVVVTMTPLLKELVLAAMKLPERYSPTGPSARLVAVVVDQLRGLTLEDEGRLPIPRDPRLARIAAALLDNPGDARLLDDWAKFAGVSSRTLLRLFHAETGMSFDAWRTQMRVATAIAWLTEGRRVTNVAYDLGYENPSAFIAMFRKQTGLSPRKYLMR